MADRWDKPQLGDHVNDNPAVDSAVDSPHIQEDDQVEDHTPPLIVITGRDWPPTPANVDP